MLLNARFVKVYRSDKLCGNDHSYKVCGNTVEKLAVPTNIVGMLSVLPYSVYMYYFSWDQVHRIVRFGSVNQNLFYSCFKSS